MLETLQHLRIRFPRWITAWSIFFADALLGAIAYNLAAVPLLINRAQYSAMELILLFVFGQTILGIIFLPMNFYRSDPTISRFYEIQKIVRTTFIIAMLAILLEVLLPGQWLMNAREILRFWLVLAVALVLSRWIFRTIQKYLLTRGYGLRKTIIVGINDRGFQVANEITAHMHQGFDLVGFVRLEEDIIEPNEHEFNMIGEEKELKSIILDNKISEIIIAPLKLEHTHVTRIITRANGSPVSIKIVPDLHEVISGMTRTEQIYGLPLIKVNPNLDTVYNTIFKRVLDIVISSFLLILMLPFLIIIAVAIKLDSRGPIFYKQERVGKAEKHFIIFKFRTMDKDAEKHTGPVWSKADDARITSVGKVLRRFRLDELPQILMVLKGDMSMIGPRPERPFFVQQLAAEFPFYYRRQKIRPGITGWSQIKHPYDQNFEDVRQKLKYDFYYIENVSFSLDFKIILNTVWVMISGKGR